MPTPTNRLTRLQKIAIFLVVMGEDKAREILGDLDLETIESINAAMQSLKDITLQEKAATMIEFGDFFYKDKPLSTKLKEPAKSTGAKPATTSARALAGRASDRVNYPHRSADRVPRSAPPRRGRYSRGNPAPAVPIILQ